MANDKNHFENGTETNWTTIDNMIIDEEESFDTAGEKLTFIVALRHAFQLEQDARPSQKTMAKKVRCSERSIRNYLTSLQTKGFLEKRGIHEETQAVIWRVTIPDEIRIAWMEKQLEKQKQKAANKMQQQPQQPPQQVAPPYQNIIDYLNEKTGRRYTVTDQVKKWINGRFDAGRTFEDFKHVIDVKVIEWKGIPEIEDKIRPKTLFTPDNFDSYLNQGIDATLKKRAIEDRKRAQQNSKAARAKNESDAYLKIMDRTSGSENDADHIMEIDGKKYDDRIPEHADFIANYLKSSLKKRA